MRVPYQDCFHLIEPLLAKVEKPSRYIDHEWGTLSKADADYRCCMIYPDVYEVGLPNQGIAILYNILNQAEGISCERDEDIVAIANLADHVLELGRSVVPKARRGSISVSISVSVFIPKAATPFQWCPQLDYDDVKRRQKLLITSVRNRAVRVHYHDAETSLIEAALSPAGHLPQRW